MAFTSQAEMFAHTVFRYFFDGTIIQDHPELGWMHDYDNIISFVPDRIESPDFWQAANIYYSNLRPGRTICDTLVTMLDAHDHNVLKQWFWDNYKIDILKPSI